jgi:hypothetical protein
MDVALRVVYLAAHSQMVAQHAKTGRFQGLHQLAVLTLVLDARWPARKLRKECEGVLNHRPH